MKEKGGFITVELIMTSSVFLILIAAFAGIFVYIYPTISLQREVSMLTRQAQQNGGITNENLISFKEGIEDRYSFVAESDFEIEVEAFTDSGLSALGVSSDYYISKKDKAVITINVKIPSNNGIIKKRAGERSSYYYFEAVAVSEKY